MTQQVSHRSIKYESRLWSQRGTKVNGSHHGDNPLLRPSGIQIVTKHYAATLQAMAPTNVKMVHQTSLLHIESSLDRLGLLSPAHDQLSQRQSGQITLQPVRLQVTGSTPDSISCINSSYPKTGGSDKLSMCSHVGVIRQGFCRHLYIPIGWSSGCHHNVTRRPSYLFLAISDWQPTVYSTGLAKNKVKNTQIQTRVSG